MASMAPSAIMSLHANTVSISGWACSMFWNTVKPCSRSQFAVCDATILMSGLPFVASRNPRIRESPVSCPGIPSSTATVACPPDAFTRYSPMICPPR